MRTFLAVTVMFLPLVAAPARAQTGGPDAAAFCAGQSSGYAPATLSAMVAAFNGRYLSGGTPPNTFNELTTLNAGGTGSVSDYKRGPANPVDPSTANDYATIQVSTATDPATIQYTYQSGFRTPALKVGIAPGNGSAVFCDGSAVYTVATIKSTPS